MADNVIADPGADGATFATDDIAGVHYPRTKITWGPDGTANDTDNASGKRLPVNIAETIAIPVTDNGGALTVDGTVAVTNAGLTELAAAINASSQMDVNIAASGATVPVSNAGLTEVAAAINASSQMDVNIAASAATLTVASHAVTNAGTFPVQASQSGTWNVDIVSPADYDDFTEGVTEGTPAMGVYEATPTSVIDGALGIVGISSTRALRTVVEGTVTVTGAAAGTEYTEDAAAAANPVGGALLLVRNDARTGSLTTTDGDNVAARGTNTGELYVKHVDAIPITDNSGSLTVDGTVAVTNAGLTELAAAINASSQMDVNIAASAATLTVASHAVTNAGTFAVQVDGAALTALQVIDNPVVVDDAAFTPATTSVMMAGFEFDDSSPDSVNEGDAGAARMSANRNQYVQIRDNAGNERGLNIDASGQLAATVTNATAANLKVEAVGSIAHDSADSTPPVKIGAKANADLSAITLVTAADRTDLYAGLDGVLIVRENSNLESLISGTAAITDGSSTSVIASSGAGVRSYITDVSISNSSATYVTVDIRDGTAGSVLWTFPAPATSGCVYRFASPLRGSAATAVAADPSAAASTITVSLGGFKSKV